MSPILDALLARRTVLKGLGATVALAFAGRLSPNALAQSTAPAADASKLIVGKSSALIVHSEKPFVFETPLELLRQHQLTPAHLLYMRNNQNFVPGGDKLTPLPLQGQIEIAGLVEIPQKLEISSLSKLPQVEVTMVMQCSGNGRSFFSAVSKASGSQWKHGGMGNVRFKGVPLRAVLEAVKIKPEATHITLQGLDAPFVDTAADYEKSVPLGDALNRAILALEMNGAPLAAAHGGPVRLVIPGYYGTTNIKWLSKITLADQESSNVAQASRYRVPLELVKPGSTTDFNLRNSRPNWRQAIKSVVFFPLAGERVKSKTTVSGVAWNDGSAPLSTVEISIDGGQTWQRAELALNKEPYAWQPWKAEVTLPAGAAEIWVRATDATGHSQPLDGTVLWNDHGYEWNGVEKIKVTVG